MIHISFLARLACYADVVVGLLVAWAILVAILRVYVNKINWRYHNLPITFNISCCLRISSNGGRYVIFCGWQ